MRMDPGFFRISQLPPTIGSGPAPDLDFAKRFGRASGCSWPLRGCLRLVGREGWPCYMRREPGHVESVRGGFVRVFGCSWPLRGWNRLVGREGWPCCRRREPRHVGSVGGGCRRGFGCSRPLRGCFRLVGREGWPCCMRREPGHVGSVRGVFGRGIGSSWPSDLLVERDGLVVCVASQVMLRASEVDVAKALGAVGPRSEKGFLGRYIVCLQQGAGCPVAGKPDELRPADGCRNAFGCRGAGGRGGKKSGKHCFNIGHLGDQALFNLSSSCCSDFFACGCQAEVVDEQLFFPRFSCRDLFGKILADGLKRCQAAGLGLDQADLS